MSVSQVSPGGARVSGRPVVVEVYLLRCAPDGSLAYRCRTGRLRPAEGPDAAAVRIAAVAPEGAEPLRAVHSTSWRHLRGGTIVLTYVVVPDPQPSLPAVPIRSLEIAHGARATRPTPARVHRRQVAAHAARHLALVAETDPQVRRVLADHPTLSRALAALPLAGAGRFGPNQ